MSSVNDVKFSDDEILDFVNFSSVIELFRYCSIYSEKRQTTPILLPQICSILENVLLFEQQQQHHHPHHHHQQQQQQQMLTERKMLRLCSAGSLQVLDLFTLDPDTAKGCFLFASEHIGAVKNDLFNLLWKYILCNQKGDENFSCPNLSLALDIITRFCYASRRCYLAALDNIGEIAKCIKALCATSKSRKVISSSTTFLSLLFKFAHHPRHLRVSKKREVKNIHSCHPIHPTVEPVFDSSSFITLKYTQESHNSELNKSPEQTEHGKELVRSSKKEEEEEEEEYVDTEFVEDETEIGVTTNEDDITINNDIHDDIIKNNMIDVSSNIQEQESVATKQTISSSSPSKKILSASNEKHDNHIEAVKDESVEQIRLIVRKSHDIELYENVSDSLQLKDKNISKDIGNISLTTKISMTWRTAIPWISEFELKRRIEELSILWKEALLLPTNYHDDINEINHNERELEDNSKVDDHTQKGDIDEFNDKVEDKLKEDIDDMNDTGYDIRREEEEEEEEHKEEGEPNEHEQEEEELVSPDLSYLGGTAGAYGEYGGEEETFEEEEIL